MKETQRIRCKLMEILMMKTLLKKTSSFWSNGKTGHIYITHGKQMRAKGGWLKILSKEKKIKQR